MFFDYDLPLGTCFGFFSNEFEKKNFLPDIIKLIKSEKKFFPGSFEKNPKHVPKGISWSKNTILMVFDLRFLRKTRNLNFLCLKNQFF